MSKRPPKKSAPTQEQWDWFEAQLTPETRKRLFNEAYRIVQNKTDAEDILHEAICLGAASLSKLRRQDKLFQWMFSIVRREAYHYHEQDHKLMSVLMPLYMLKDRCVTSTTPESLMITKEERLRLRREINRLPSPDREILVMKLTTNMTLKEIAAELNVNYHTTRSKFTRTRKLIGKRMKKDEGGDGSHEKK